MDEFDSKKIKFHKTSELNGSSYVKISQEQTVS